MPDEIVKPQSPEEFAMLTDFDESDPRNIINLVPHWLRQLVKQTAPSYWAMSEYELKTLVFNNKQQKSTAQRLRIIFWEEYDRVQAKNLDSMDLQTTFRSVISLRGLNELLFRYPEFLVWMLTPPPHYMLAMKEILTLGHERMMQILEAEPVLPNGAVDARLAKVQHAIYETMMDRVHGAVAQTINQKSVNLNLTADSNPKAAVAALTDMSEIDKRLALLKEKTKQLAAPPKMVQDFTKVIQPALVREQEEDK